MDQSQLHRQLQHHSSIRSIIKSKLFHNHNQHPHQHQHPQLPPPSHPQHKERYSASSNTSPEFESDQLHDLVIVHQSKSSDGHSISNSSFNRIHSPNPISQTPQSQITKQQQQQQPQPIKQTSHYLQSKVNKPRLKLNNTRPSLPALPGLPSQARSPNSTLFTTGPKILKLDHHISSPSFTTSISAKQSTSINSQHDQVLQITNSKLPSPHGSTFIRSTPSLPKLVHLPAPSLEPRPFTQQIRPSRPYPALPTFVPPNAIKITPISNTITPDSNPAVDTTTITFEPYPTVHTITTTLDVDTILTASDTNTAASTLISTSDAHTAVDTTTTTSDLNTAEIDSTPDSEHTTAIDDSQTDQSCSIPVSLPVSSSAMLDENTLSSVAASPSPSIPEQPSSHSVPLAFPLDSTTPKSRTNSEDLAEARKIILGLQLQVNGLKQQQQLPPSPALSDSPVLSDPFASHPKKRFSDALLPSRPISPLDGGSSSKRHSIDATVIAPPSPKADFDTLSLSELQPSLCALLSPNSQSSISRSSRAGSSPNVMSPKLCASTSTQSSLITTSAKSFTNSTRSLTSPRTRSRDTSFSGHYDPSYVRGRDMSSARHELIERLSIASSCSGITLSELEPQKQENLDEIKPAHHRGQPSHTSQISLERFDTPESSPPWARPNDSFTEPLARPPLAIRPQTQLRSKAGRRWQQVGDSQTAGRGHSAQRSLSSFTTSSVAHRTLSPRPPSSPPTASRGIPPFGSIHHDRKNSTYSSLGSPLTAVPNQQRNIHSLFGPESQQPRKKHGSWFTDVPTSSASRPTFRPSVNGRGLLPSSSYHRQDPSAASSSDQRPSSVQSSYVEANAPSPSLSSTATTVSTTISLPSLAEVRTMSKLDVFLIASKLASELDSATRRFGIEKEALLEALNESREMCDQLRQLCETELNGPNEELKTKSNSRGGDEVLRERVEMLEVENSRLEIRANAMANELKRAVVDLRVAGEKTGSVLKASRIPRRSTSLAKSSSKMSLLSENQWRAEEAVGPNDCEETPTHFAELDEYRFEPKGNGMDEVAEEEEQEEEEEEEMHLSDHEEGENVRAGSPASTILASGTRDEDDDEEDWIHSVHNRISLGTSSGESNIGWRLRPEDELFLQDLDEDEFDGVAADLAGGNDEGDLFTLS
ncbi:hypothetical protein DFH28DRAFT_902955 [Melampsora americana]|nr:hypothetical protein DFH28DRAFT_902955 [Melampsora americana]